MSGMKTWKQHLAEVGTTVLYVVAGVVSVRLAYAGLDLLLKRGGNR